MAAKYSQRLGRGFTGTVHQLSQSQQLLTRWRLRLDEFLAFGPQFFNITFHFLPESPVSDLPKQATFSLDRYLPNPSNFSTRRNHFVFDDLLGNPTAPQPPQSSALLPSHGSLELPTMTVSCGLGCFVVGQKTQTSVSRLVHSIPCSPSCAVNPPFCLNF